MKNNFLDLLEKNLGSEITKYLNDPDITEIYKNEEGKMFAESFTKGTIFIGEMDVKKALNIIYLVANYSEQELTEKNFLISANLPENKGCFEGVINPLVESPIFNIRVYK